jgi:hypothetical protein
VHYALEVTFQGKRMKNALSIIAIALSIISIGVSLSNKVDVTEFAKVADVEAADKKIQENIEFVNESRSEAQRLHIGHIINLTKDVRILREKVGMSEDTGQAK